MDFAKKFFALKKDFLAKSTADLEPVLPNYLINGSDAMLIPFQRLRVITFVLLGCLLIADSVDACTVMLLKANGHPIVARNHDWVSGGGLVMVNPRGIAKRAISPVKPHHWTSRYGSVSFNQFGREIPFAGMNEKGLTVDLLQLGAAEFPPATDPRNSVNAIQWVQYQLDMSATVEEVIASLDAIRPMPFLPMLEKVHYFVTDANGDAVVVEYLNGVGIVQRSDDSVLALANSTWDESTQAIQRGGGQTGSEQRFLTAWKCSQVAAVEDDLESPVEYAMQKLDSVTQSHTQWSLVYQPEKRRISFKTDENQKTRWINFDELKLTEGAEVLCADVQGQHSGNLAKAFDTVFDQSEPTNCG